MAWFSVGYPAQTPIQASNSTSASTSGYVPGIFANLFTFVVFLAINLKFHFSVLVSRVQLLEMGGELHERHSRQMAQGVHNPFSSRQEVPPHHHRPSGTESSRRAVRMLQGCLIHVFCQDYTAATSSPNVQLLAQSILVYCSADLAWRPDVFTVC